VTKLFLAQNYVQCVTLSWGEKQGLTWTLDEVSHQMLLSDLIAKGAVVTGALIMAGAAISCLEEGPGPFTSHQHRIIAKRVFWSGVAIAVIVPAIVTALHYWKKQLPPRQDST
jgi:hypothetical protein